MGGGGLRTGFLHTYLHGTQEGIMVYYRIVDQALMGLHTDSSSHALRLWTPF